MQRIIIIGNSGAARECYELLQLVMVLNPTCMTTIAFKGFLSHKGYAGNLGQLAHMQIGSDEDYVPQSEDAFVIGIADPALRRECFMEVQTKGGRLFNLISPWGGLSQDTTLGEGNIIGHGCAFSCNVRLGDGNYLNGGIRLGHDAIIGDFNFLGPETILLGGASVGSGNQIGVRSVLIERCRVGNNNRIAPGSFVYKGCGDKRILAGNPALSIDGPPEEQKD